MTLRPELEWIDLEEDEAAIKHQLLGMTHSRLDHRARRAG